MSVKVKFPLSSFYARGQFGNLLIFQHRNFENLVYHKTKIKDKLTPARSVARIDYSECMYAWKHLSSVSKEKFNLLAKSRGEQGSNLFTKFWFTELFNSKYGVGFYGGTKYGCKRPTPKPNPYYMQDVRKQIYGV